MNRQNVAKWIPFPSPSLVVLAALMLFLSRTPDARANVALFKAFIESPPGNITNLIFRVRTAGDSTPLALAWDGSRKAFVHTEEPGKKRAPLETGLDEEGFRWFLAKWQENAFLVRGIDRTANGSALANNPNLFRSGGRYGSNYWALNGSTLQTWTASAPIPPQADSPYTRVKTSSAFKGALAFSENLRQLLNLGIMSVNPGTIRWEGDHFTVPSRDIQGVTIRGTAIIEGDRVSRLELHYNEFPYLIEYGYSGELPLSYLPTRFLVSDCKKGSREFRYEFEIISLEIAPTPLGAEEFEPVLQKGKIVIGSTDYLLHNAAERHWVYTNGSGPMRLATNGSLIPLRRPVPASAATIDVDGRRRLVRLVLGGLLVAPALSIIWFRMRKNKTKRE